RARVHAHLGAGRGRTADAERRAETDPGDGRRLDASLRAVRDRDALAGVAADAAAGDGVPDGARGVEQDAGVPVGDDRVAVEEVVGVVRAQDDALGVARDVVARDDHVRAIEQRDPVAAVAVQLAGGWRVTDL